MVFNARHTSTIVTLLMTMLLLVGALVVGYALNRQQQLSAEYEHHAHLWQLNQPQAYRYEMITGCMSVNRYRVEIDQLGTTITASDESLPYEAVLIDDVFAIAATAIQKAHQVETHYHPYFGFPVSIEVDWESAAIDDECFVVIEGFENLDES
ncbi:DUF6174 domain-containing protein [Aestuariibacter halophilus]|uniref:DUF6174 domain-containing protein n=1 Tax=Fluctibacter halophilus TaxID=226011 RepID=A0ABS8G6L6_9ALTE|nr:DUF6174 domain-containing protein [Aestuariibacter halophilus]MCC2616232.1 DUF6174 domain-containing protein [Aestuariibacter halophilus]